MIRSRLRFMILLALIISSSGCALIESPRVAFRRMKRMYTPNPVDSADGTADDAHEWDFVGDEGRADGTRERDPDPWFKQYLMSSKANSIERNLGID